MAKPILGAQMYTVHKLTQTNEGFLDSLKKIRDIGYTTVQVSGIGAEVDPEVVAVGLEETGLRCAITHMSWDLFLKDIKTVIAKHKMWKCEHTAIGGLFTPDYQGLAGLDKFLGELPPVLKQLKAEGLDFSFHNHSHELIRMENGQTWLEALYKRTDPSDLKAEIDTYWIQHGGADPARWVERYGRRMPVLHIKDMKITSERVQRYAPIGEGNLNWERIFKAAEETGIQYAMVEQDDCYGEDPFDCLARSFKNCKAMGWE